MFVGNMSIDIRNTPTCLILFTTGYTQMYNGPTNYQTQPYAAHVLWFKCKTLRKQLGVLIAWNIVELPVEKLKF